jgi:hypothetical protein
VFPNVQPGQHHLFAIDPSARELVVTPVLFIVGERVLR